MKRVLLAFALCVPMLASAEEAAKDLFVKGDAAAGATKAAVCGACHGPNGNSANAEWPKIAGLSSTYTYSQLKAFQKGERKNAVMMGQVAALSDQDLRDLAAYYANQKMSPGVTSKDAVAIAEKLYRAGDATRSLAACSACHGPTGAGNPGSGYPRISGQHATYGAAQLRSFRTGERSAGLNGQMMKAIAAKLTDQEIDALASYINGLQ